MQQLHMGYFFVSRGEEVTLRLSGTANLGICSVSLDGKMLDTAEDPPVYTFTIKDAVKTQKYCVISCFFGDKDATSASVLTSFESQGDGPFVGPDIYKSDGPDFWSPTVYLEVK